MFSRPRLVVHSSGSSPTTRRGPRRIRRETVSTTPRPSSRSGRTNRRETRAQSSAASDGIGVDNVGVRYNPGAEVSIPKAQEWADWRSDVVLYHELVHAMDDTSGHRAEGQVDQ